MAMPASLRRFILIEHIVRNWTYCPLLVLEIKFSSLIFPLFMSIDVLTRVVEKQERNCCSLCAALVRLFSSPTATISSKLSRTGTCLHKLEENFLERTQRLNDNPCRTFNILKPNQLVDRFENFPTISFCQVHRKNIFVSLISFLPVIFSHTHIHLAALLILSY